MEFEARCNTKSSNLNYGLKNYLADLYLEIEGDKVRNYHWNIQK